MEKSGQGSDNENNNQAAAQTSRDARRLSIQRCIQSLVHAVQCRNADCSLPSCQKMKRVVQHTKGCKKKTNGGCPVCKQLIALCCYHAKHCQEDVCPVPFCLNIKHKFRQQSLQHRLQQAQMLRRRMASIQRVGQPTGGPPAPVAAAAGEGNVPQAALQELLRTLRSPSSPSQQQQVLNILRSNPALMAAFIRQRAARYQGGQGGPGGVGGPPQGAPVDVRLQQAVRQRVRKTLNRG